MSLIRCAGLRQRNVQGDSMAGRTGIEPVTSDVTGRRSNQLNYHPNKDEYKVQSS